MPVLALQTCGQPREKGRRGGGRVKFVEADPAGQPVAQMIGRPFGAGPVIETVEPVRDQPQRHVARRIGADRAQIAQGRRRMLGRHGTEQRAGQAALHADQRQPRLRIARPQIGQREMQPPRRRGPGLQQFLVQRIVISRRLDFFRDAAPRAFKQPGRRHRA